MSFFLPYAFHDKPPKPNNPDVYIRHSPAETVFVAQVCWRVVLRVQLCPRPAPWHTLPHARLSPAPATHVERNAQKGGFVMDDWSIQRFTAGLIAALDNDGLPYKSDSFCMAGKIVAGLPEEGLQQAGASPSPWH